MTSISFFKQKNGSGDYEVVADGVLIGYLCKRYSSLGAMKQYWRWLPCTDSGKPNNFDKFLDAKRHVVNIYA